MLPLLGGQTSNAGPQNALDALSRLGQTGPQMPDFSGQQFGGLNNLDKMSATNPFAMSGPAGAAASRLPTALAGMGQGAGGGMGGLSGSINKLIASNNKLVGALNKLAASLQGGGGGGGAGPLGLGMGLGALGGQQDPFGIFEQLNLQKAQGVTPGGPGGAKPPTAPSSPAIKRPSDDFGVRAIDAAFSLVPNTFGARTIAKSGFLLSTGLTADYLKSKMGVSSLGMGTQLQDLAAQIPLGIGLRTAQDIGVIKGRVNEMGGLEKRAFQTAAAIGMDFQGSGATAQVLQAGYIHRYGKAFGLNANQAMEQIQDVYTTGGFRTGQIGGTGRDALERGLTVDEIFRFKRFGFGSTVMGGIQELMARGSGARQLGFQGPAGIAQFGANNQLGARGMNKLTQAISTFGQQANMFGMDDIGSRARLFQEAMGFENVANNPTSFRGFQNAVNRVFMTQQAMSQGVSGQIGGMFSGLSTNMGMAMSIRQARQQLGPNAGGVELLRRANDINRNQTPQEKVAFMRSQGFSDDVIQARLMGAGLDEGQIQYALSDTRQRGLGRISGGQGTAVDLAAREASMPLSSQQAANNLSNVIQTYESQGNLDKMTAVINGQAALERVLFENANYTELNTNALINFSDVFNQIGSNLNTNIQKLNRVISAINRFVPGPGIPTVGTNAPAGTQRAGGL